MYAANFSFSQPKIQYYLLTKIGISSLHDRVTIFQWISTAIS